MSFDLFARMSWTDGTGEAAIPRRALPEPRDPSTGGTIVRHGYTDYAVIIAIVGSPNEAGGLELARPPNPGHGHNH